MNRKSKKGGRTTWVILSAFVAAGVMYVLSFGPMYWVCTNSRHELIGPHGKAFATVYQPIIRLYQTGPPPLHKAIGWYLELFER